MKRISWAAIAVAVGIVSFSALSSSPPPVRAGAILVVDAADGQGNASDCSSTDVAYSTIQAAIDAATPGDTISVCPGTYNQDEANDRDPVTGGAGSDDFNIFVNKALTIQGVNASGVPITDYNNVAAYVIPKRDTGGGHTDTIFVQADDVTITGLDVTGWTGDNYGNQKTLESIGDSLTVKYNQLHGVDGAAALYMYDPRFDPDTDTSHVQAYLVEANLLENLNPDSDFGGGTWGNGIRISSGPGWTGPVSGRIIKDNDFQDNCDGIEFVGPPTDGWDVYPVGDATITGNSFSRSDRRHVVAWGAYDSGLGYINLDWHGIVEHNTFDKAAITWTPLGDARPWDSAPKFYQVRGIYSGIQRYAINKAVAGDTVQVLPGTYNENVSINKPLVLQGTSKPVIDGGAAGDAINVSANGVTIDGFEIRNGYNGIMLPGISNAVISNNEIHDNVNVPGSAGAGILFWGDNDNNQILNNVVHDNDRQGIFVGHDTLISTGNTISGNTVYHNGRYTHENGPDASDYGIQLWNADSNVIANNEVYGHDGWEPYPDFDFAQGIYLYDSNNNVLTGNYLHDNNYGVGIWGPGRGDGSNHINLNSIAGNTGYGVMSFDANLVDATGNWWGDASGPRQGTYNADGTGNAVAGNVAYSPWLGIGDGSGDPGFQPASPMTWEVEPHVCLPVGCIQRAVNLASGGDTIQVKAGSYNEQVIINKSLTVNGAGKGVSVIAPSPIAVNSTRLGGDSPGSGVAGIVVVDSTTGVTIRDLTVDGAGNALTVCDPPAVFGVYWRNASGTIEDSEVRNIEWGSGLEGCQGATGIFAESGGAGSTTVTIDGNSVHDVQKNGITAVGSATTATISGNTVVGWGFTDKIAQNGIEIGFGAGGSITGNEASLYDCDYTPSSWWAATGILVTQAADGVVISGNNVHDNLEGIYTDTLLNLTVSGNTVTDTRDTGVYLLLVDNSEVSGNSISSGSVGLWLADSSGIAAKLNTISGNGDGVVIDGDSRNDTFTANKITNNTRTGVSVAPYGVDPSGIVFRLNQIAGNGTYGIDNTTSNVVDALSNWWGDVTGPYHPDTNPFGLGNKVSDYVSFDPWLKGIEYVGDTFVPLSGTANLRARFVNSDDSSPAVAGITVYFDLLNSHGTKVSGSPFSAVTQSNGVATATVSGLGVDVYTVTARWDPLADTDMLGVFGVGDTDGDGIPDVLDNCPTVYNSDQTNTDAKPIDNGPVVEGDDLTVPYSDGYGDACDDDDDNDGLTDAFEAIGCGSGPTNPLLQDTDGDRAIDGAECLLGSNPNNPNSRPVQSPPNDSDGDGIPANIEALLGSSDNIADTDGDGIEDGIEFMGWGTSPVRKDSNSNSCGDNIEIADVNGDGWVDSGDLLIVAYRVAMVMDDDLDPDPPWNFSPAFDVNKDGYWDSGDLYLVAVNSVRSCE